MSKKYERKRVDSLSLPFELYHDVLEELDEHQFTQVIKAGIAYSEAEANNEEFKQPEFDPQSKLAFNILKRHIGYSNELKRRYNFNAKYNRDFNKGDKVPPELVSAQYKPEDLEKMGYNADEIEWIKDRIKAYKARAEASGEKLSKKPTESKYDQRENTEPDGNSVPQWLIEQEQRKKQAQ